MCKSLKKERISMPMTTIEELDPNDEIIDTKNVFIAASYAEELDHHAQRHFDEQKKVEDHLRKIDNEIFKLAYDRRLAIECIESSANELLKEIFKSEEEATAVVNAWNNFGWSSSLVKAAVKLVRDILFDQCKTKFNNIVLVKIELSRHSYEQTTNYLKFVFCKDDFCPESVFTFWIPIVGTASWNWKESCIDGKYKITYNNPSKRLWWSNSSDVLVKSFSLEEISNAVRALVLDDREALTAIAKKMKMLEAYSNVNEHNILETIEALTSNSSSLCTK